MDQEGPGFFPEAAERQKQSAADRISATALTVRNAYSLLLLSSEASTYRAKHVFITSSFKIYYLFAKSEVMGNVMMIITLTMTEEQTHEHLHLKS